MITFKEDAYIHAAGLYNEYIPQLIESDKQKAYIVCVEGSPEIMCIEEK